MIDAVLLPLQGARLRIPARIAAGRAVSTAADSTAAAAVRGSTCRERSSGGFDDGASGSTSNGGGGKAIPCVQQAAGLLQQAAAAPHGTRLIACGLLTCNQAALLRRLGDGASSSYCNGLQHASSSVLVRVSRIGSSGGNVVGDGGGGGDCISISSKGRRDSECGDDGKSSSSSTDSAMLVCVDHMGETYLAGLEGAALQPIGVRLLGAGTAYCSIEDGVVAAARRDGSVSVAACSCAVAPTVPHAHGDHLAGRYSTDGVAHASLGSFMLSTRIDMTVHCISVYSQIGRLAIVGTERKQHTAGALWCGTAQMSGTRLRVVLWTRTVQLACIGWPAPPCVHV